LLTDRFLAAGNRLVGLGLSRPRLALPALLVVAGLGAGVPGAQAHADNTPPAATKPAAVSRPLWSELSTAQQQSLAPLAPHWNGLHAAQKRKWIALSRNYDKMNADDQTVLHSRMTEWAALSAQERTRARLNFDEVKRLAPADERKAKWEAYQALSDDEKRKLAERAGTRPPSAAAAVRPVPAQKLAPVPRPATSGQHAPRIELAPSATATPASSSGPASPANSLRKAP
jgi:hypothetical protein